MTDPLKLRELVIGVVIALATILVPGWWSPWAAVVIVGGLPAWWIISHLGTRPARTVIIVCVAMIAAVVAGRLYWGAVSITSVSAPGEYPGEDITITGNGFSIDDPKMLSVHLAPKQPQGRDVEATIRSVSNGVLDVRLPKNLPEGDYDLTVTGVLNIPIPVWPLRNSAAVPIKILGKPEVAAVAPPAGHKPFGNPGTTIIVTGKNFDMRKGGIDNRVFFGNAPAPARAGTAGECGAAADCLVATVPAEAPEGQSVPITVEAGKQRGAPGPTPVTFEILGQPSVDGASLIGKRGFPKKGSFAGTEIEIRGTGFDPSPLPRNRMRVTIGGKQAEIVKISANAVTVRIPADPADGRVIVEMDTRQSMPAEQIEILQRPQISDFAPRAARVGETIEITGSGFDLDKKENNSVRIGKASATIIEAVERGGKSVLRIKVPEIVDDQDIEAITVTTPAVGANESGATMSGFQLRPLIESFNPGRAHVGDPVAIHGQGLLPDVQATLHGIPMAKRNLGRDAARQRLEVIVPPGARTGPITLTQGFGASETSRDEIVINRFGELRGKPEIASNTARLRTGKGVVTLRVDCEKDLLIVTGDAPAFKSTVGVGVGRCPVDVDVDPAKARAYTANFKGNSISEVDLADPASPRVIQTIDVGTNPTRVRILNDGRTVVASEKEIYLGTGNRFSRVPIEGSVVAMLSDPAERSFVVTVASGGPNGTGMAAVVSAKSEGFQKIELGKNSTAAALLGSKIYVANYGSDTVSSFNVGSSNVNTIPLIPGAKPFDIARNPASSDLFVTQPGRGRIAIVDTRTDKVSSKEIKVGPEPKAIAFSSSGCLAVVFDTKESAIVRIDPNRSDVVGNPQPITPSSQVRGLELRQDSKLGMLVFLLLSDGTREQIDSVSCPPR